jgi:hypothetical protein
MILKQAGIIRQGKQTSSHLHAPDNRKKKERKQKKEADLIESIQLPKTKKEYCDAKL